VRSSALIWQSANPDRAGKIVAFGANTVTSGMKDDADKNPTFASAVARAQKQYEGMGTEAI
jgi:hypothetical protein